MLREKEPNGALEQALGHLYQSENVPAGFETGWRAAVRREESRMKLVENSTRRPFWRTIVPAFAALVLVVGSLWAGFKRRALGKERDDRNGICRQRLHHLGRRAQRDDGAVCRYGHV